MAAPPTPWPSPRKWRLAGTLPAAPRGRGSPPRVGGFRGPPLGLRRARRGLSRSLAAILQISQPSPGNGSHGPPPPPGLHVEALGGRRFEAFAGRGEARSCRRLPSRSLPGLSSQEKGRPMAVGVLAAQRGGSPEWGIPVKVAPSKPGGISTSRLPLSAISTKTPPARGFPGWGGFSHTSLAVSEDELARRERKPPLSTGHDGVLRRREPVRGERPLARCRGHREAKGCALWRPLEYRVVFLQLRAAKDLFLQVKCWASSRYYLYRYERAPLGFVLSSPSHLGFVASRL